ncbi:hypothetical protein A5893_11010 [Pedobacter psychrophilus]|uniref:Uncharacterized protein n=1 Tax=Pedobacter psychrophilus TaxID=1826909 RepID=A0A179DDZ6_9SPHI|nr:hypothetical protein [Pedobacter psychrophilus]OAQ39188.1 hypothetical protein A5893_11010 [Pedobacter psychrophilus]
MDINFKLITDVLSPVSIVVSLLYLAQQVRFGANGVKTGMQDSSYNNLMQWNYRILAGSDLSWIFQSGCKEIDSLDEKEKAKYIHIMFSFFKLFENMYLHYCDHSIKKHVWEDNNKILESFINTPGAKQYFEVRKSFFNAKFIKYVEGIQNSNTLVGIDLIEKK